MAKLTGARFYKLFLRIYQEQGNGKWSEWVTKSRVLALKYTGLVFGCAVNDVSQNVVSLTSLFLKTKGLIFFETSLRTHTTTALDSRRRETSEKEKGWKNLKYILTYCFSAKCDVQ
jgi:hypothetical protein